MSDVQQHAPAEPLRELRRALGHGRQAGMTCSIIGRIRSVSQRRTRAIEASLPMNIATLPTPMILVETHARSRVVLPGHSNERFVLQEQEDGSILLQPAFIMTQAQAEYDTDPEFPALLARAARSTTIRRTRKRRVG